MVKRLQKLIVQQMLRFKVEIALRVKARKW